MAERTNEAKALELLELFDNYRLLNLKFEAFSNDVHSSIALFNEEIEEVSDDQRTSKET